MRLLTANDIEDEDDDEDEDDSKRGRINRSILANEELIRIEAIDQADQHRFDL